MKHDAIVIRGSYAGWSAAIDVARARRSACVIDDGMPRNRFTRFHRKTGHPVTGCARQSEKSMNPTIRIEMWETCVVLVT